MVIDMKKTPWILLILSVLLIAWAIEDFYHYAVIGQKLLQHYGGEEAINSLVNYSLVNGVIKVILGVFLITICYFIRKKKK